MRNYPFTKSLWARSLLLGAMAVTLVAGASMAGPATMSDAAPTDTAGATTTASTTAAMAPSPKPAEASDTHTAGASKPTAKQVKTAVKQTYTVVEANGIKIAAQSVFDLDKPVNLKKGQMLILKSSSGQMIEVDGPLQGKPADHYTAISDGGTMGYDAKSFTPPGGHAHCSGSGAPHPSGGPNPDETGGAENQATHC